MNSKEKKAVKAHIKKVEERFDEHNSKKENRNDRLALDHEQGFLSHEEHGEILRGAQEMYGNEMSPGPLVNINGRGKPRISYGEVEALKREVMNSQTFKNKTRDKSPRELLGRTPRRYWGGFDSSEIEPRARSLPEG